MTTVTNAMQVVKELREKAAQFTSAADLVESINHRAVQPTIATPAAVTVKAKRKAKRHISPAGRARIAAAARARWARVKSGSKIKLMKRKAA